MLVEVSFVLSHVLDTMEKLQTREYPGRGGSHGFLWQALRCCLVL